MAGSGGGRLWRATKRGKRPPNRSHRLGGLGVLVSILVAFGASLIVAPRASAVPTPVTITITEITQIGTDVDPGPTQGPVGDFYAGASSTGHRDSVMVDVVGG